MKICCIGCGYVGLVAGTCLADMGNDVICVDVDKNKINNLKNGLYLYTAWSERYLDRNSREKELPLQPILKKVSKNQKLFLLQWEHLQTIITVLILLPLFLLLKILTVYEWV